MARSRDSRQSYRRKRLLESSMSLPVISSVTECQWVWPINSHILGHFKMAPEDMVFVRVNIIGHFSWPINYSPNTVFILHLYMWSRDHKDYLPWSWLNFRSSLLKSIRRGVGSIQIQFYLEHVENIPFGHLRGHLVVHVFTNY